MQRGFQRAVRQDLARLAATRQLALGAWLSRLGRSRQAVLAMALLVAAVLPMGLALREVGERDRELAQARSILEQERQRSAAGSRSAAEAERLRSELEAGRRDLAGERQARASVSERLAEALQPQANVAILFLGAERSGSPAGGPSQRVRLPRAPGWIVLALEIEPPHQQAYRAVLRDAGGRELWRGGDLRLDERDALSLSLPSSLLAPGDYTFEVSGLAAGRRPTAAGRFAFRVLPA